MNMRMVLALVFVCSVSACKAPPKPAPTDDTIVTSEVNGVTLTHRYAVHPPKEFEPVKQDYRALYPASLMSTPDFGGKVIRQLTAGKTYVVLGQVEHFWLALADEGQEELIGYVPMRAVVKSELYDETLRKDKKRRIVPKKQTCVSVDGSSKACKNANSGTWIID
ncbi:SH3 domain-containing protein [Kosakonia sp. BK9b]|uniref:SH3 domain-containing protein n=1 Tax=Kosakonia sp. TaxID=1916651 RepID=UPI00289A196C|nr:SH3 domain-containing protein [Kosakonia sp.]